MRSPREVLVGVVAPGQLTVVAYAPQDGPRSPLGRRRYSAITSGDLLNCVADARTVLAETPGELQIILVHAGPDSAFLARLKQSGGADLAAAITVLTPLEALAAALPLLGPADLEPLTPASRTHGRPEALLALGPGLTAGYRIWDGSAYQLFRSWHDQLPLPALNYQEEQVLALLGQAHGPAQVADGCSPEGLFRVYTALRSIGAADEPAWFGTLLAQASDPGAVVLRWAQARSPVALCAVAVETYTTLLGTAIGSLALTTNATGGLYIGGELAGHLLRGDTAGGWFKESLRQLGRPGDAVHQLPILRVVTPDVLSIGAAVVGLSDVASA